MRGLFGKLFKKKEEPLWREEEERKASAKEAREVAEKRKREEPTSNPDPSHFAFTYVWGKYREYALTSRKRKAELTAWRFRVLGISYQTTADKLEQLCVVWKSKGKTDEDTLERNEFIRECEAVISIENSAWMAELTK